MPQVSISIPQALLERMKEKVSTGHYSSNSEVVREGLRLLFKDHSDNNEIVKFDRYLDSLVETNKDEFLDANFDSIINLKHEQQGIK